MNCELCNREIPKFLLAAKVKHVKKEGCVGCSDRYEEIIEYRKRESKCWQCGDVQDHGKSTPECRLCRANRLSLPAPNEAKTEARRLPLEDTSRVHIINGPSIEYVLNADHVPIKVVDTFCELCGEQSKIIRNRGVRRCSSRCMTNKRGLETTYCWECGLRIADCVNAGACVTGTVTYGG